MEGGREEDAKEEQRKRLSLFSRRTTVRQNVGFRVSGPGRGAGIGAVAQPGRKPAEGGQGLEQALARETHRKEVFTAADVPMGNLRKVVRSPRKNSCRGGVILASRPFDVASVAEKLWS